MNSFDKKQLEGFKSMAGQFYEEVKSNSVTDLLMWIECKLELKETKKQEMRATPRPRRTL